MQERMKKVVCSCGFDTPMAIILSDGSRKETIQVKFDSEGNVTPLLVNRNEKVS